MLRLHASIRPEVAIPPPPASFIMLPLPALIILLEASDSNAQCIAPDLRQKAGSGRPGLHGLSSRCHLLEADQGIRLAGKHFDAVQRAKLAKNRF